MLELIISGILLIIAGVSCISIVYWFKRKKLQQEREYLQMQQILLQEHYEVLEKKMELTRQYRKDIKKHMAMLDSILMDSKEGISSRYQAEIEKDMAYLDVKQYCANSVVNAMFLHKIEEAKKKGIKIEVQMEKFDCLSIKDIDLVGIFCNLFDNAIEACMNILDEKARWMSVDCENIDDGLFVDFKNAKNPKVELKNGRKTWKKNQKDHGIGLEVLADLVKKNKGRMEKEEDKDWYEVKIWMG